MLIFHLTRATRHLLLWGLFAAALIFTLLRIVLADISEYRIELEQKIRDVTHIPMHIGKLSAKMRFFSPGIVLQNITIDAVDNDANPAIKLREVRIRIDLLHMLGTFDFFSAIKVTLVGAKIDLIRESDGSIFIKGLEAKNEAPLWLLQGSQYEILQSDVSWLDKKSQGKRVEFRSFDILLKNRDQEHEIHLLASLPTAYGDALRISALLKGNFLLDNGLDGQIYIEAENLQGPSLANAELLQGFKIDSGQGNLKLWGQLQKSSPTLIAGYLQAENIKLVNPLGKSLAVDHVNGNLSWQIKQGKWQLGGNDIDIIANNRRWLDGALYVQQDQQGNWSTTIKKLDFQALVYVSSLFLPNEIPYFEWTQLNLRGQLKDFTAYIQTDLKHYALQGSFVDLGSEPVKLLPGLQGLSGWVSGSDQQGRIEFASEDVVLDDPNRFRNTQTINRLSGAINWQQQAEDWLFSSRDFTIDSPDFQTETDFDLSLPKNQSSPKLDLLTSFVNLPDVSRLPLYYPAKIMDKDALNWMDQAFIGGKIAQGELVIRGNLDQFPFADGQGLFEVVFSVENGELQFHPDWPHAYNLNVDFQYRGQDLKVAINSGHGENVDIKQLLVEIDHVPVSENARIKGKLESKLQNALLFLQKSPLHSQVDPLLKLVDLESVTDVDLDLVIPYHEHMPFGINVDAHLNNARLLFKPINMPFKEINGSLHFSENSIGSTRITANALGFPIQGQVKTDNTGIHLLVDGVTGIDQLKRQFNFLPDNIAKGSFPYRAELTVPFVTNQAQTLNISSNLQGLLVDTQNFFDKTAEEQSPFKLNFQFDNKPMLPIQVNYGHNLNAALLLDTTQNRLYSAKIVVGQGEAQIDQQAGLNVEIKLPEFKLSQVLGGLSEGNNRWPPLREIRLETENLIWQGQNLGGMECYFQHENQMWQGTIQSTMAKGRISIPDQRNGDEAIQLDMDYLNLSAMNKLNFDAAEENIETLPLIDIDSQQLLWRSVNLGKLKLQTERLNNGIHFKKIKLHDTNRELDFNADWIKLPHGSSTLINGSLNMDGFGQFLTELGISDDFKETNANISFTGGWSDTPQQFSLERLHGKLQVKLADGSISSIEPGLGRLLGLISMEQWAKRLSLDFSDIYRQGLAFNKISGDFKINNGTAYTDNLLMDAVIAKMKISGTVNLLDKTLDEKVTVIPKSSDALPIAGTIVGGIAEAITNAVTGDYKEGYFFGSEYKIAGHWGNVEVSQVNDHDGLVNKTWHGLTNFNWMK